MLSFAGFRASATSEGIVYILPGPSRIDSLYNMPEPQNKTELQSFLGMINVLRGWIPELSVKTKVLRDLTRKNVHFQWGEDAQQEFDNLKIAVSNFVVLSSFDPASKTFLNVDSCYTKGFGYIMYQVTEEGKY